MPELSLENPIRIQRATKAATDPDLMTLAAFLLAAGVWYRRYQPRDSILPPEELEALGLSDWQLDVQPPSEPLNPYESPFVLTQIESANYGSSPTAFHVRLGELISQAVASRGFFELARAVIFAANSPDALVRVSALTSAFEMFNFLFEHRVRMLTGFGFSRWETSAIMAQMLLAKTFGWSIAASGTGVGSPPGISPTRAPGLILIHGTNFPPKRPIWSVPHIGALFKHIGVFRTDIYGGPDYFRWEGGYSDYAREVASMNLENWISRRKLSGIDAVTHSHGGNVLMAATNLGINFGRVVFLSCPVHWNQYQPRSGSIKRAQSVRIRFDFVILADRAHQRFPANTIPEDVLPVWFITHSVTTEPNTWKKQALDKYIR